ncbi:MAG: cyaB [Rariglobus sp.]|jgi:adenylate cyclase|nr:cyaB [Rariglobus sp.]
MNKRATNLICEYFLPTIVCIGLALALGATPWLQRLENITLDNITQFRVHYQTPPDPRVVVVGVDDASIDAFGLWPWKRVVHGEFMYAVSHVNPSAVAWDILFLEPSDFDGELTKGAAMLNGRVVFGAYASDDDPGQPPLVPASNRSLLRVDGDVKKIPSSQFALRPVHALQQVGLTAFCDTPAGPDGVRRHVPMLQRIGSGIYPSLSLQTLMLHGNLSPQQVRVVLGEAIYLEGETLQRRIPIDEQGRYLINYRFGQKESNNVGFAAVTISHMEHYVFNKPHPEKPDLKGKILLVGQFSTGLSDNGLTPFGAETPLVLVHANVLDNILREDYARRAPLWPVLTGALLIGVIGLLLYSTRTLAQQALFGLGVPAAYLAFAAAFWTNWSLWLPLLWPVLGFGGLQVFMIVRQLVREQRAKMQIKGMFGTYLSPELVNRMIESGESPQLGGHEETITAYFSDIQSFSTFSEKLPPDRLVELMNEYLTACTDIVLEEGGSLDKYIGDAVVMMFGAPMPLPNHALRACIASQRVQLKLAELREKWKSEGDRWPSIVHEMQSRIGLNSGPVIVGNMGSRTRFNYTMMGDNVNLAARMESGAKNWGVYSMCTEATREACVRDGGDRVVFRPLGRIVVKGRSSAVPIFEIIGLKENVTEKTRECMRLFEQGLESYYARDWDGALALFAQSGELEPNQPGATPGVRTNPSRVYSEIASLYKVAPPPENWEGEYVMTVK